jgi:hypothetical protein
LMCTQVLQTTRSNYQTRPIPTQHIIRPNCDPSYPTIQFRSQITRTTSSHYIQWPWRISHARNNLRPRTRSLARGFIPQRLRSFVLIA